MRTYGRKYVKRYIERKQRLYAESRDAILWDINEEDRICRVKIQGSDELIVAHFPLNWSRKPRWLKVGNAVRVQHRSGTRGFIEVVSDGRAIPTAVEGGSARPPVPDPGDAIIYGLEITPGGGLQVQISAGTFRIDGVLYSVSALMGNAIIMDDPAPMTMGVGTYVMGVTIGFMTIAPPPSEDHYYRYDNIVVGTDGEFHYYSGEVSTHLGEPIMPTTPDEHLQVGWILMYNGVTEVGAGQINREWTEPEFSSMTLTYDPESRMIQFSQTPSEWLGKSVTIHVLDQYLQPDGTLQLKTIDFTQLGGCGSFGSMTNHVASVSTVGNQVIMGFDWPYHYDGGYVDDCEYSPLFKVEIRGTVIASSGSFVLLNEDGSAKMFSNEYL